MDGYNFQNLKAEILQRSVAKDWDIAKTEWYLTSITTSDYPETCLCGHTPIIDLCEITNRLNGKTTEVGNKCVKRFLGFRSDLIFQSLRRIQKDSSKSLGPDATVFFFERSILNKWEYDFQQDTLRKRNLTPAQLDKRRQINTKILLAIKRKGIS